MREYCESKTWKLRMVGWQLKHTLKHSLIMTHQKNEHTPKKKIAILVIWYLITA